MERAEAAYQEVIAPGGRWSRRLESGEQLRIVDLEGQQAVDFLSVQFLAASS